MSRIVWLASYPKSGNTWLRIVLTNFLRNPAQPIDINTLDSASLAVDRKLFDHALGIASSDLTQAEVERFRPAACRHLAQRSAEKLYITSHDAYTLTPSGEPLIPADVTQGAIYVVRNPLDVAVSFAHHLGSPLRETVRRMGRETTALGVDNTGLRLQLRQRLLSWNQHVLSWLDQDAIPVHLMRYEDMLQRPLATFAAALRFLGLPQDSERLHRAVEFSSFDVLRKQEQKHGFRERQPGVPSFFRAGRAGGWRGVLTQELAAQIVRDHGEVMCRLGFQTDLDAVEK